MRITSENMNNFRFTDGLAERLIEYFKENYCIEVSSDEAQLFLGSLAEVYTALCKPTKG